MILSSKPKLKYHHTQPAQILRQVESNTLSAKKTHHCVIRVERIWTAAHNAQHPISPHTPPSHPSQEACFYSMSCKWVWPFPQPPTSRSLSLCFFLPLLLSVLAHSLPCFQFGLLSLETLTQNGLQSDHTHTHTRLRRHGKRGGEGH